jgi:hypothetical protein
MPGKIICRKTDAKAQRGKGGIRKERKFLCPFSFFAVFASKEVGTS